MDTLWLLCSACLVFTMQAGFLCLESGLVRSKNSINVAAKNITDFTISSAIFWLIGFGIMFGDSVSGFFGLSHFMFGDTPTANATTFFIFQMMFCGTAATLVSGAVAERTSYIGYVIITVTITLCIYPIIGHWAWAGIFTGTPTGWLEMLGFVDFAGSTVVHSVGGWVALAAILIIGPRIGRYDVDNRRIPGSNLPMAVLGAMLIWFGWFGFNGGSTLAWSDNVPSILLNTLVAALWGGISTTLLKYISDGYVDVLMIINGVLGGLVSITANCHAVSSDQAFLIGIIGGIIVFYGDKLLEWKKIDDAISVIPVHLFAGIWGTVALALLGDPAKIGTGLSRLDQLEVQLLGIASIGLYSFVIAYVVFKIINHFYPLRVDANAELIGLNVAEHRVSTEVFDLLAAMHHQQQKSDFSSTVPVEPFTEVGQIAQQYNRVIDKVNQEIKQRDQAFSAYKESEFRKGAILQAAMDCIVTVNERGEIIEFNPAAEQCFGMSKRSVMGQNFFALFITEQSRTAAMNNLSQGFVNGDGLVLKRHNIAELTRSDGEEFPAEVVITQTTDTTQPRVEYTLHIRDITQQIKLQNRLKQLAYNDPLTGLYNRTYFMSHLKQLLQYHQQTPGSVVLMFLDLDQFKKINDNLGHKAGDELLCEVAHRLGKVTRELDLVGRWGGDEFVIVLSGDITLENAESKAMDILSVMRAPVTLAQQNLVVPTSIGIAISVNGQVQAEQLLQHADIAMYKAKQAGRNTYRVFLEEMSEKSLQHFQLEHALPDAIKKNQLFLEYQPKVSCETSEVVGFEALLRWKHPDHGLIMPGDFIPVIDESNMIIDVGEWVIENVIKQLSAWRDAGATLLPIAINISGHHLHSNTLSAYVEKLMTQYGIRGDMLEFEITEGVLTGNTEESIAALSALKKTHIRLSIDDFGTGYSSLSYLKKFPVDVLKIDQAFIRECSINIEDAAICKAIITLAKSLGLEVIAEGVENQEQLQFLKQHHCDVYQGYYFSRPIAAKHVMTLLEQNLSVT
ncbi:ammonium transporter [Methylophaga sp.]|uniref:ammonium transporter n=1 Tax=Methylophaga sp. TaxID=2024840 RepID=UPI003A8E3466